MNDSGPNKPTAYTGGWPWVWRDGSYNIPSIWDYQLSETTVDITAFNDEVEVSFCVPGELFQESCSHPDEVTLTPEDMRAVMRGVEWVQAALSWTLDLPEVVSYRKARQERGDARREKQRRAIARWNEIEAGGNEVEEQG